MKKSLILSSILWFTFKNNLAKRTACERSRQVMEYSRCSRKAAKMLSIFGNWCFGVIVSRQMLHAGSYCCFFAHSNEHWKESPLSFLSHIIGEYSISFPCMATPSTNRTTIQHDWGQREEGSLPFFFRVSAQWFQVHLLCVQDNCSLTHEWIQELVPLYKRAQQMAYHQHTVSAQQEVASAHSLPLLPLESTFHFCMAWVCHHRSSSFRVLWSKHDTLTLQTWQQMNGSFDKVSGEVHNLSWGGGAECSSGQNCSDCRWTVGWGHALRCYVCYISVDASVWL